MVSRDKFAIVFPTLDREHGKRQWIGDVRTKKVDNLTTPAPPRLVNEIQEMVSFKTALLPPKGYVRGKRWQQSTAEVQVARYGLALGILAAPRNEHAGGLGVPVTDLTLGLFAFPEVWEWYLTWYEKRRGFFSSSEKNLLYEVKSLNRNPTEWVRQNPQLARRVRPIEGLITREDIAWAKSHWNGACDRTFGYAQQRVRDIHPLARMHRDPFIAIMPVLTAKNPLRLYKRIGDEVLRHMPDPQISPTRAAVAVRSYVAFRIATHTGLRQRNLRELLICPRGKKFTEVRELETLMRGEMRWNREQKAWGIFAPAVAIKNGGSAFFQWRPFQMALPDLDGLYGWIDEYLQVHRPILLNGCRDPGTFFVRTMMDKRGSPELDVHSFYFYWKDMVHRYGIYNPYTKRGAIKGLLPHGPHCVRDVLATHLLKTTGSYELASFAIQDSVESVMRHYARFLPHEKIARAAEELNKVWRH